MQIRRLRLANFRQYADTVIEFAPGLTGIVGPNGAGKSTLLEAIAWAMYGTSAARGTRDSIRRRSAPARSRVEVELDFELGVHQYRVVRSLQTAALYQDGETAPIANSGGAVTSKVTRLMGMSRDEFFNTYFTGQKELAIMASMSAPERARFLSRVLGYERLAAVQVKLKDDRTAIKASLQTAEQGLVDPAALAEEEGDAADRLDRGQADLVAAGNHRVAADEASARLRPEWNLMEERRDEVQSIETDLNIAEHAVVEARNRCQALDLELTESLEAKAKADELLPELAEWDHMVVARERLDAEAQASAGRRAIEAQVEEVGNARRAAEARLAELPDQARLEERRARMAEAQERVEAATRLLDDRRTEWVREKQNAETEREGLLRQHKDFERQKARLVEAGPSTTCPTCGKPLGKEYVAVLDDLETKLLEILSEGRHYSGRIKQLAAEPELVRQARRPVEMAEEELQRLTTEIGRLEEGLAERGRLEVARAEATERLEGLRAKLAESPTRYDEAEHRRIRDRIVALEPLRVQLVRLTARAERAAELVPRATEAEQQLTRYEANAVALRAKLSGLGWSVESYDALKVRVQTAEQERQAAEVGLVRAQAERDAAREHQAAVRRRREERDRRAAQVAQFRADLLFNTELDRAFSDLRTDLNATLRPDLADAASALLADLTGGRYSDMELDEDYIGTIIDAGEPQTVISGGEEDVANLALRLAISQMIADRAGQPFSLLILDEVFGSLDEDRRSAVVSLLRGLADRFPQVILITHIESVREGFDRIIRIDFDVERGVASAREERVTGEELSPAAA